MIAAQRHRHNLLFTPRASLPTCYTLLGRPHRQDGSLWRVYYRAEVLHAVHAEVANSERATGELFGPEFASLRLLRGGGLHVGGCEVNVVGM